MPRGFKPYKFKPFVVEVVSYNHADKFPIPRSGKFFPKNGNKINFRLVKFFLPGHRIATDNRNLYVFGGYNFNPNDEAHSVFKEILKFNLVSIFAVTGSQFHKNSYSFAGDPN